jgi:hypothetical protein
LRRQLEIQALVALHVFDPGTSCAYFKLKVTSSSSRDHALNQEAIMFQVLDHAAVVFSGELSQTTQYILDHYGKKLDEAIRSGIKIAYAEVIRNGDSQEAPPRTSPEL